MHKIMKNMKNKYLPNMPLEDCWYGRLQLFYTCHLRPAGGRPPKNPPYRIGPDDMLFHLDFFSTFEELNLPIHGPMEDAGLLKLYYRVTTLPPSHASMWLL
jgi:hypothetical protein